MNRKSLVLIITAVVPTCTILFSQMRARAQEQGARLHDFNSAAAVSVGLENPAPARFGDPLRLRVTLHNTQMKRSALGK